MRGVGARMLRTVPGLSLLLGLLFGVSSEARAVNVMQVYNSVDLATPDEPGRYVSPTTTLKTTSTDIADDYQCGGVALAPVYLYIARADQTDTTSVATVCEEGTGDEICGFDLTVLIENVSSVSSESFWISGFSAGSSSYAIESNLSADQETLRINGVNTAGPHSLPVFVGTISLERADEEPGCPASCVDLPWCGSLKTSAAKIVRADLSVEELNDTVPLVRLPEPAGGAMWWAGVTLLLGLSWRRQRAIARVGE